MSSQLHDDEQSSLRIQREVGIALRLSFESMTHEPLPEEMTILLLRLALAQAMRMSIESEAQESAALEEARQFPRVAVAGRG